MDIRILTYKKGGNVEEKSLDHLSSITGISKQSFLEALATTPPRRESFTSEARRAAPERWNALSLEEVEKVSTVDEAVQAFDRFLRGSEASEAALERWNALSLEEVESASTFDEAVETFDRSPKGSEAGVVALRKIHHIYMNS